MISIGQFFRYSSRIYSQSIKCGRTFLQKKLFIGDKPFRANLWGLFYMGELMVALYKGRDSVTNAFSSDLNTIYPNVFPKHGEIEFILEVNS